MGKDILQHFRAPHSIGKIDPGTEVNHPNDYNEEITLSPIGVESQEFYLQSMQEEWDFEYEEKKKSNLLSAIAHYVAYKSGCTIETNMGTENLTTQHSIRLGTGSGSSILFPSQQGDELLEFMLIQKVIDSLRTFKKNFLGKR